MQQPTLYALSTCAHCAKVKGLLEELGVDYNCVYVDRLAGDDRNKRMRELKRHNPELSFPTLVAGDDVIVGSKEEQIRQRFS